MSDDQNTVTLKFTPDSMKELQMMAKKLNTSIPGLIGKALAFFRVAQNKTVILQTETTTESVKIKNFTKE